LESSMNDPEYKEALIIVDSLGHKIFEYVSYKINSFNFATKNLAYIWAREAPVRRSDDRDIYLSINNNKRYIRPREYGNTYDVNIDNNGNITIISRKTKQTVKTIKPEDWQ
ncbi:MAG: hypothetical protein Q7U87_02635, partial [bacterium]|nr:hypothetical protein [bacterium]